MKPLPISSPELLQLRPPLSTPVDNGAFCCPVQWTLVGETRTGHAHLGRPWHMACYLKSHIGTHFFFGSQGAWLRSQRILREDV